MLTIMLTLPRSNDGACLLPCEDKGSCIKAAAVKLVEVGRSPPAPALLLVLLLAFGCLAVRSGGMSV